MQKKIFFVGPALFHFKKYHNFLWICSLSIGKKICLILFPGTWNTTTGIAIKHVIMHDKLGGTQNIGQGKGRKKSQKERICRHPQLGRKIITLCLKFFWHPIPTAFWRLWSWKNNWQNLVCQLITSTAQLMPWATFVACYFSLYFAATLPWATFVLQLFCPAFWTSHIRGQKCELLDGT